MCMHCGQSCNVFDFVVDTQFLSVNFSIVKNKDVHYDYVLNNG